MHHAAAGRDGIEQGLLLPWDCPCSLPEDECAVLVCSIGQAVTPNWCSQGFITNPVPRTRPGTAIFNARRTGKPPGTQLVCVRPQERTGAQQSAPAPSVCTRPPLPHARSADTHAALHQGSLPCYAPALAPTTGNRLLCAAWWGRLFDRAQRYAARWARTVRRLRTNAAHAADQRPAAFSVRQIFPHKS